MAPDDYWVWRKISDVVNDLKCHHRCDGDSARPDGPALQIAKQSNQFTVPSEAITMTDQMLAHANVIGLRSPSVWRRAVTCSILKPES